MANPSLIIIDQAVRHFLQQWHCGFQPSLTLKTLSSGAVCVSSNVSSFNQSGYQNSPHYRGRRKSGLNSRVLRQKKRQNIFADTERGIRMSDQDKESKASDDTEFSVCSTNRINSSSSSFTSQNNPSTCQQKPVLNGVDKYVQAVSLTVDVGCETEELCRPKKRSLSVVKNSSISIASKPIYHPAIHRRRGTLTRGGGDDADFTY